MGDFGTCNSGTHCKAFDPIRGHAYPTEQPLCQACLDPAERDTRALVYDYLDLAQLHQASMSQAITEKTAGSKEKTMLLVGHVEALQAEIVHVTTTWETEIRAAVHLSAGRRFPIPAWATTVSRPLQPPKVRAGAATQRAVRTITTHLRALALLPPTTVRPTGVEDDPVDMYGWEAVHHLQTLHSRARATLGRTTRTFWIPGECWTCDARPTLGEDGPLSRAEPRYEGDPMQVRCQTCGATRPYADYEHFTQNLQWPGQHTDQLVRLAA